MGAVPHSKWALPVLGMMAFLLAVGVASAEDIRVPEDHSTIQEAVDNASAGDVIIVGAGTFGGSVVVDRPVTITGKGSDRTRVLGDDPGFTFRITGTNVSLQDLAVMGHSGDAGILLIDAINCTVEGVKVDGSDRGIWLDRSSQNHIQDCMITSNGIGIQITNGSRLNTIINSDVQLNIVGLDIGPVPSTGPSSQNSVINCTLFENPDGIVIGPMGDFTNVERCRITKSKVGIDIGGDHVNVTSCYVIDSSMWGIHLEGVEDIEIVRCTFNENGRAVRTVSSNRTHVARCSFYDDNGGVWIWEDSHDNVVEGCVFQRCGDAVYVRIECTNVTVRRCEFLDNKRGMWAYDVQGLAVDDCTFEGNEKQGLFVGTSSDVLVTDCVASNTTTGSGFDFYSMKGPFSFINCSSNWNSNNGFCIDCVMTRETSSFSLFDCEIVGNGHSGVFTYGCEGFSIIGNDVRMNTNYGLYLIEAVNATLSNNTVMGSEWGFRVHGSNGCVISGNVVSSNRRYGIYLGQSGSVTRNHVWNNTISANGYSHEEGAGISFWGNLSRNNTVELNDIVGNNIGVLFGSNYSGSYGNVIRLNWIHASGRAGLFTNGSGPNLVYLNNFTDNAVQVEAPHIDDAFDNGKLGNYWDDYTRRYPYAMVVGRIWDIHYEVEVGSEVFDRYPLAFPYRLDEPIAHAGVNRTEPAGKIVQLDGSGSFGHSPIAGYIWNITEPDGYSYEVVSVEPTLPLYLSLVGDYLVELTVQDVWGNQGSTSVTITSVDVVGPQCESGGDYTVNMGEGFTLDASASTDDIGIVSFEWMLHIGPESEYINGTFVNLTIDEPGVHWGLLNVTDAGGNSDHDFFYIFVIDHIPPVADAGPDFEVGTSEPVELNGTGSWDNVGIAYWRWEVEFGGNTLMITVGEVKTVHLYDIGLHNITLTVTDKEGNEDTDIVRITTFDTSSPRAKAGDDKEVAQGETVVLDASNSFDNGGIASYRWEFSYQGEEVVLEVMTTSYAFEEVGTYTVTLTVTDLSGNIGTDVMTVTVLDIIPPLAVIGELGDIHPGGTLVLNGGLSEDNNAIVHYIWTVRSGNWTETLSGMEVELTLDTVGEYNVTLTVYDAGGLVGRDTANVRVLPLDSGDGSTGFWGWMVLVALFIVVFLGIWYYSRGAR